MIVVQNYCHIKFALNIKKGWAIISLTVAVIEHFIVIIFNAICNVEYSDLNYFIWFVVNEKQLESFFLSRWINLFILILKW